MSTAAVCNPNLSRPTLTVSLYNKMVMLQLLCTAKDSVTHCATHYSLNYLLTLSHSSPHPPPKTASCLHVQLCMPDFPSRAPGSVPLTQPCAHRSPVTGVPRAGQTKHVSTQPADDASRNTILLLLRAALLDPKTGRADENDIHLCRSLHRLDEDFSRKSHVAPKRCELQCRPQPTFLALGE